MKSFLKICSTMISIFLLVGIVLIGIGIWQGGLNETLAKIKNGDFSFTIDSINTIKGFFVEKGDDDWNGNTFNKDYPIEKEGHGTKEFVISGGEELVLDFGGIQAEIKEGDTDKCVIAYEEVQKFQAYEKDGVLYIKAINSNTVGKIKGKLSMTIPKGISVADVALSAGAGSFKLNDIICKKLKVELGAGSLEIEDISCEELDCDLGAGNLEFKEVRVKSNAKFEAGAGQTIFTGTIGGDIKAVCAAGEMLLTLKDTKEEEHNYTLVCAAGSLRAGNIEISGLAGEKKVDNGADTTYDITTTAGSFALQFE